MSRTHEPLTILSDTHIGHSASVIRDPEELAPLFGDSATVVFNGDTVEMLWRHNRGRARAQLRRVASVCRREGARPVFVTGNHDPFVSAIHHLDLREGRVLVTHGDILFHEVAPWSRGAEILGPKRTRILRTMGADALEDFERQLLATKWTSLALEMREPCSPSGWLPRVRMLARETWPPWRVLRILRFWMETPDRAAGLARAFRPRARFVVVGHTHHAGVFERDGRVVVNTGAYLPFSKRLAVRLEGDRLSVVRVVRRGRRFRLGRVVRSFGLERPESAVEPRPARRQPSRMR